MIRKMREREYHWILYKPENIVLYLWDIFIHFIACACMKNEENVTNNFLLFIFFLRLKCFNTKHVKHVHLLVNFNKSNIKWYLKLPYGLWKYIGSPKYCLYMNLIWSSIYQILGYGKFHINPQFSWVQNKDWTVY